MNFAVFVCSLKRLRLLSFPCLFILVFAQAAFADSVDQAMQLLASGQKAEARRMLGRIVAAHPNNFDAQYRLGLVALDSNDLTVATASLEKASRIQPAFPNVWLALAQTYLRSNRNKLAYNAAEKAEALAPDDPVILHGLAIFYSQDQRWSRAAEFEERYAVKSGSDSEALSRAVTFHLNAKQAKQAIELAKKGLAYDNRADLRNLLGKAYEADGQFDKTILELQEAIRLKPDEESYYFDLAQALLVHQNFDVAIRVLEAAREHFKNSAQLELALGVAYYGQRRFSESVDAFLRTAALAPEVEQPYIFLGRIIEHGQDRLPEITQKFAEFAAANPANFLGPFLHAKALIAQAGSDEKVARQAESLLRKSIGLNNRYWESHLELALLLERKKDLVGAAAHLERSAQLNPGNPGVHYRLARVYDRLQKPQKALAERMLHEKLVAAEKAAVEKHAAGAKRLEVVVK